ncbi:MAG: peptidylprolyl isomerase [Candidatus Stahlbacteria bacterium]|nr:MAG: peptidylprolyl isomerase [Candidatus Stahlbacteria bacterium]
MRKALFIIATMIFILAGISCGPKQQEAEAAKKIYAAIEVEERGIMLFELYPENAPNGVAQFTRLAKEGFYDGLLFWHISDKGLVQSGCPNNDGTGHAGNLIKEEIEATLHHERGTLSMINFGRPWTTSSQFIICRKAVPELDGRYTIIGKLMKGEEVLDEIERNDKIKTVTIKEE